MNSQDLADRAQLDAEPQLSLAAEFPSATGEQWWSLVADVLRKLGAAATVDPASALRFVTYDGLELQPLYTAQDAVSPAPPPGVAPFVRGAGRAAGGWDVRQLHADPEPAGTSAAIVDDLAGGVRSLWLRLGSGAVAIGDLDRVLQGVDLSAVAVVLDAGGATHEAANRLFELARSRETPLDSLMGSLGADPIAAQARSGVPAELSVLGRLATSVERCPLLRLATVDATVYHEAGGSDADELAMATAVGVAYLRELSEAGLSIDAALAALEFRFVVTADQFGSIAKLRAARRIWDRVAELSGAGQGRQGQSQHATTSTAMLTRRDPWVNLLRATIGCFAAAIGGAEAITVAPFDAALGLPDDLGRRLARNTQAILHDESSLGRVLDAAGGSWYVESRTQALAERAWDGFTAIERAGGALAALNDGFLDRQLSTARAQRQADVAHRRAPITGVSEFADFTEEVVRRSPARATAPDDTSRGDGVGSLPAVRDAEPFESLRDRADAYLAATGARPRVLLAVPGPVAAHAAALAFAASLFAAGGIEAVTVTGDVDELVAAMAVQATTVVCLCPPGDGGRAVAAALEQGGATLLWLAGQPVAWAEAAGGAGHLHSGVDAVAVLTRTLDALGVPA